MRKRNHAYKPKPLIPTLGFAYTKEHALQLKLMPHTALEALRTGDANEDNINTIIIRLDWGVILIKNHFDQEQAGRVMNDGLNAVISLQNRFKDLGRYIATGEELKAIGDALNAVDDMQDTTTRREQWLALNEVQRICAQRT